MSLDNQKNATPRETTLSEVCHLVTDGKHGDCENQDGSGYYFLSCKDIKEGKLNYEGSRQITKEDYLDTHRRTQLEPKDILITNSGTIGRMAVAPDDTLTRRTTFQKSVAVLKPDHDKINHRWLYYYLLSEVERLITFAGGTAQKNLLLRDMRSFKIKVPVHTTQHRIASILSAYDNLIENNTRRITILEEMARRLYEEWFVKFRFPGHEAVSFAEQELGPVPNSWDILPLEDVCERITDGAHKSPKSVNEGKPMASVKDMHDWGFDIGGCRHISENDYQDLVRNDCKPLKGDVLIAKDGSYLKHTFVVEREFDLAILSSIAILRPNEKIRANWLSLALRHPSVVARMKGIVSGVAIPRIVLKDFRKFPFLVPPIELQEHWESLAGPMMTMCRRLIDKNSNLRSQRDLLLPKLVSGEIDVSEVELPDTKEIAA